MLQKKIVLIRCPQPRLLSDDGQVWSADRRLSPEPTLPQLEGILQRLAEEENIKLEITQLDLRHPSNGRISEVHYDNVQLPYIPHTLHKVYEGITIAEVKHILEDADYIGFTNAFGVSRKVVCLHIQEVRRLFPNKEIWIGGRDVFDPNVEAVYVRAAGNRNLVLFRGHAFESLPAYLRWILLGKGQPSGLQVFDNIGKTQEFPVKPLTALTSKSEAISIPLPIYPNPTALDYFTGSGEGYPNPPFGRFVHMTISVGCPNVCGYCTTGNRERYLVYKDLKTIQQELELYKRLQVTHIAIMDDNPLCLGVNKVREIMELINSYDFQIEYGNGLQLSLLSKYWEELSEPILQRCISLYAPLEDLTQDKLYSKLEETDSQLTLMRRIAHEAPESLRYVTMGVIIGVPSHTRQALNTTFMDNVQRFLDAFSGTSREVAVTVFNYMPLPGTPFGNIALYESGRMITDVISDHPEISNFELVSYAPEGMSHADVFHIYEQSLNLNPAGKELGICYTDLQRKGIESLPEERRVEMPPQWRIPGSHYRSQVP